jgi:hypothetical protein
MTETAKPIPAKPTDPAVLAERRRRQRGRNWAVLAALVAFCAVMYAITIVRLRGS